MKEKEIRKFKEIYKKSMGKYYTEEEYSNALIEFKKSMVLDILHDVDFFNF